MNHFPSMRRVFGRAVHDRESSNSFTGIGGQPRINIAAIDAEGAATAWNSNASGGDASLGEYAQVNALAVSGGVVRAGGAFTTVGAQPQAHFAAISEGYPLAVSDPSITAGSLTVTPNPARAAMQIQYAVARAGRVRLELLDVSGRVEATLVDRVQEPGRHMETWNGVALRGRLSPGLHFIRFVAPDQVMVRKLAIIW